MISPSGQTKDKVEFEQILAYFDILRPENNILKNKNFEGKQQKVKAKRASEKFRKS